jgi:hypothetical protein
MSVIAAAVIGSTVVGAYAADKAGDAQQDAAKQQGKAADKGIALQEKQFDAIQKLLAPYVEAGTSAVGAQKDLIGLGDPGAQQRAIAALQGSPQFQALTQQGEDAILANASATGGLRGGNTQSALAQFRPQLLAQLIEQQYGRLGGLTSVGQNAAAGVGNAGMNTTNAITQLLEQKGAAAAGGALAAGQQQAAYANLIPQAIGMWKGLGGKF